MMMEQSIQSGFLGALSLFEAPGSETASPGQEARCGFYGLAVRYGDLTRL